jgi:hypothetical protein
LHSFGVHTGHSQVHISTYTSRSDVRHRERSFVRGEEGNACS